MDAASILFAAISVLGTKAVEQTTKLAVVDAWSSLKPMIKRKFGAGSPALEVLEEIERQPADTPATPMLTARVAALKLVDDPEIAALLRRVESLLAQQAPGFIEKQYNFHGTFHNTTFN
jgi:hypothetical protein